MADQVTPHKLLSDVATGLLGEIAGAAPDLHWHPDMALPETIVIDGDALAGTLRALGHWACAIGPGGLSSLGIWMGQIELGDAPGSLILQAGRRHEARPTPDEVAGDDHLAAVRVAAQGLGASAVTTEVEDGTERVTVCIPDVIPPDTEPALPWGTAFARHRLLLIRRPILSPARLERSMALTALNTEFVPELDSAIDRVAQRSEAGEPYDFVGVSAAAFPGRIDEILRRLRGAKGGEQLRIILTGGASAMRDHPLADRVLVAGETSRRLLDAVFDLIRQPRGASDGGTAVEEVPSLIGRHILIVEDVAMNRALLQAMLSPTGATLSTADDGEGAIEAMRMRRADIVLMDIMMPKMDGLEATRRIKEIAPDTAVIALTAHARDEDKLRYLAAGMDGYLAKPIKVDDLYSALRRALG